MKLVKNSSFILAICLIFTGCILEEINSNLAGVWNCTETSEIFLKSTKGTSIFDVVFKQDAENLSKYYIENIKNPKIILPRVDDYDSNVFHIFPILCETRDELQNYLIENGVQTLIHYPIPPHLQECYQSNFNLQITNCNLKISERIHNEELSLPISPVMSLEEAKIVVDLINKF